MSRTLYRPVGLYEMLLILESDLHAFPPRLPHQPIFYPVLNFDYAAQIARDWNTGDPNSGYAGFVTAFEVSQPYIDQFEEHIVGASTHRELWVPAEELETFNQQIEGRIRVQAAYYGDLYEGAEHHTIRVKAKDALVILNGLSKRSFQDVSGEIQLNRDAIFVNYAFWTRYEYGQQIPGIEKYQLLKAIAALWLLKFPEIPLLTNNPTEC